VLAQRQRIAWYGYGDTAQHTANASRASQSLARIHWSTPVDTNKPEGEILIHYGSPVITPANTVLVPVKFSTGFTDAFKLQAFAPGVSGTSPRPLYELPTDYSLPPHDWIPPYGPALTPTYRLYYPGAGGTVYFRDRVDSPVGPNGQPGATGQIAFYGTALYNNPANKAIFDSNVQISTPLVSDRDGNIYFGFIVLGQNAANLVSGLARISIEGEGSWVSATAAAGGDPAILQVQQNCTPALSNDGRRVYFTVMSRGTGYLVSVNSRTLEPLNHIPLDDPRGGAATVSPNSSASPMVGPDGDVFFGVLESDCCESHNGRGWMLHFDSTLTRIKTPGSFGWDATPTLVHKNLIAASLGTFSYYILTKYNNYLDAGTGDGVNKIAILDPDATMPDPIIPSVTVMKEVRSVTGITPDGPPPAVKEWCINSAAVDPFTRSAIVNSEDGTVYRWDFASNTLTQRVVLNPPTGESYTPTIIGPDGTIYAINDGILYALGN
jgi:hypothetical protein